MPSRKTLKFKKRGGVKIGEGSYGKVYRPPLQCNKLEEQFNSDEYISKVLMYEDIEKEMGASTILSHIDKSGDWSIRALHFCRLGSAQTNKNYNAASSEKYQLIYKYAGNDFNHLILSVEGAAFDGNIITYIYDSEMWTRLSKDGFILIIRLIKELLPQIRKMNETMYHCDMHLGNMVYDGSKPRLIDFGLYKTRTDQIAYVRNSWKNRYLGYGVTPDRIDRVMEDLEPVIENDVMTTDIGKIYKYLHVIINSPWGKSLFKNEFKWWRIDNMTELHTYDKFYGAIMAIPV